MRNGAVVVCACNSGNRADSNWQQRKWEENSQYKSSVRYEWLAVEICPGVKAHIVTTAVRNCWYIAGHSPKQQGLEVLECECKVTYKRKVCVCVCVVWCTSVCGVPVWYVCVVWCGVCVCVVCGLVWCGLVCVCGVVWCGFCVCVCVCLSVCVCYLCFSRPTTHTWDHNDRGCSWRDQLWTCHLTHSSFQTTCFTSIHALPNNAPQEYKSPYYCKHLHHLVFIYDTHSFSSSYLIISLRIFSGLQYLQSYNPLTWKKNSSIRTIFRHYQFLCAFYKTIRQS